MSRDHRSLHSAVALCHKHGIEIDRSRPAQHRRPRAADTVLANPTDTDDLVATLRMLCPAVREIPGTPSGDCPACEPGDTRPADVEIYHRTADGRQHDVRCGKHAAAFARDVAPYAVEVLIP